MTSLPFKMLINSETFSGNILGIFFFFLPCSFTSIEFPLLFSCLATQYHTILQYQEQHCCDICFSASFVNDEYSIPEPVPLHPGLISRPTLAQESIFFYFLQFRVFFAGVTRYCHRDEGCRLPRWGAWRGMRSIYPEHSDKNRSYSEVWRSWSQD